MTDDLVSRQDVLDRLVLLREEYRRGGDHVRESAMLDALDIVTGWCSPHLKIESASLED